MFNFQWTPHQPSNTQNRQVRLQQGMPNQQDCGKAGEMFCLQN
ncbi:hypothetical protein SLEP1_g35781 [Rubroshorea leprosula]|uniref:Uncharacterized protein n=1 Tax=Rubroshorea leprosula TaxID=152421 RepID=A0AAV5KPD0_9ROSI|nr:hypothetical protein SLEP1_g35781 [Rubroshorea leprosula]